jgi:hypothetical protein
LKKQFAAVTLGIAAGMSLFGGVASADTYDGIGNPLNSDESGQVGLVNVNNLDAVHNLNAVVGFCDNNVNVLGVQVPVRDVANGIGVPILSPGEHDAEGQAPYNCASGGVDDGGTSQNN